MGGSSSPPQETDAARHEREKQDELLQAQIDAANKPIVLPKIPKPKPTPPPPTSGSADQFASEDEARRRAAKRTNTLFGTTFAGETSGYNANSLGGQRTLLGG